MIFPMNANKRQHNVDESNIDADKYASYEQAYDPEWENNQWRRERKAKKHNPKKAETAIIAALADETVGLEGGFAITYKPARFETAFLRDSVRLFFEQALITDILAQVKGGKEASVYRCVGHPTMDAPLLAAKVYRPRQFRNLSNDAAYREGRQVLKDVPSKPVTIAFSVRSTRKATMACRLRTPHGSCTSSKPWSGSMRPARRCRNPTPPAKMPS
jgi:hypothetical protein